MRIAEFKDKKYLNEEGEKLIGTTRVIGWLYPFNDMIEVSPVAIFWANKLIRLEEQYGTVSDSDDPFDDGTNDRILEIQKHISNAESTSKFFKNEGLKIAWDGNYAEEYAAAKFENREIINEPDAWGNLLIKTDRAIKFGDLLHNELLKLGNIEMFATEVPLHNGKVVGKFDYLVKNKDTNEYTLIDFKTGSRCKNDKLKKAALQLSFYKKLVEREYGIKIANTIIISAYEHEATFNGKKRFIRASETINIGDKFNIQQQQEIFEKAADTYSFMRNRKLKNFV